MSIGLGVLGLMGGILGSTFFGGLSYQKQKDEMSLYSLETQRKLEETRRKQKTLDAIATPKVGRQVSTVSYSPLASLLGFPNDLN